MKEEKAFRLSVTLGLGEMDKLHITVKRKVFSRFSSFLLLISYSFFYGSISGFSWWVSKIFFVSFFLEIPVAGYDFLRKLFSKFSVCFIAVFLRGSTMILLPSHHVVLYSQYKAVIDSRKKLIHRTCLVFLFFDQQLSLLGFEFNACNHMLKNKLK
jgi:hypothetical protein